MKKPAPDQIDKLLTELWQKNLPALHERLDLLDRTASSAASGTLEEASRTEAIAIAHKLSGSLGMFGHQESTQIAASIERILKAPTAKDLATLPMLAADLRKSLASAL